MRIASRRKLAGALALLVALLAVVWMVSRLISWGTCSWYGYQTDRQTRYAALIGCMVRVDQQWVPRNELRIVQ